MSQAAERGSFAVTHPVDGYPTRSGARCGVPPSTPHSASGYPFEGWVAPPCIWASLSRLDEDIQFNIFWGILASNTKTDAGWGFQPASVQGQQSVPYFVSIPSVLMSWAYWSEACLAQARYSSAFWYITGWAMSFMIFWNSASSAISLNFFSR